MTVMATKSNRSRSTANRNPIGLMAPPASPSGVGPGDDVVTGMHKTGRRASGDTAADRQYAADAERAREDLVQKVKNLEWRGQPLLPWSEERARLLDALCAADIPAPDLESCDPATFFHGAFPRAIKVLYLALHQPEEWQPHRARLLVIIDQWGIENVPAADITDKIAAVQLTLMIERAHRAVLAMHRPNRGRGVDLGN